MWPADKVVIVTGGAGLIGSFLVDHLIGAGARVIVVDDLSKGRVENLAHAEGQFEWRVGDLEDRGFAREALAGAGAVFHLASRAYGIGYSSRHHQEILEHNERVSTNLFEALRLSPPERLLITSSSCVYPDDGPDTVGEIELYTGEPERANWGYGWAKRFLEQKGLIFHAETGVPVTIVRPFNIYGERYNWVGEGSQAIPMIVKRILDGEDPVVIWGSGRQSRTYVHASDCARIMLELVGRGVSDGPVNIGWEETVSVRQVAETIARVAGLAPQFRFDASKPEGRFVKSSNATRLRLCLPEFEPTIPFEEGIERMQAWYRATFPRVG